MRILGIDPGGSGALALLEGTDTFAMTLQVRDMPIFKTKRGKGTKAEIDIRGLIELLEGWHPNVCYFEKVQGMLGDAPSTAFNFGRCAGATEAVIKGMEVPFHFVTPQVWKKGMGLLNATKDDSRNMAINRWPSNYEDFKRKMDDGRAEAALIAEYGRQQMAKTGIFS